MVPIEGKAVGHGAQTRPSVLEDSPTGKWGENLLIFLRNTSGVSL